MSDSINTSDSISKKVSIFPSLPDIAARLLEELSDRSSTEYQLIALVEAEAGMTEYLLAITNQTLFGQEKLSSLQEIIDLLGRPRFRNLVLAYAVNRFYADSGAAPGRTTGLSTKISWDHGISVAYIAVELARRIKYPRLEEVMLAGLTHDIGRLMMMMNVPSEYSELLGETYGEVVDMVEVERNRIGFSHDQVGAILLHRWQFSHALIAVASYHHNCELEADNQILVNLLALANHLAVLEGTSFERAEPIDVEHNIPLTFLRLTGQDLDQIMASYREQIKSYKAAFQSFHK